MSRLESLRNNFKKAAKIGGRVVAAGIVAGALNLPVRHTFSQTSEVRPQDLVFVTEDFALDDGGGCDGISVFDIKQQDPMHRGAWKPSPSRMSASLDLRNMLAVNSNNGINYEGFDQSSFLYKLSREADGDYSNWSTELILGAGFLRVGGIAFTSDNDSFLIAVGSNPNFYPYGEQPFSVKKYSLSEARLVGQDRQSGLPLRKIGDEKGSISLGGSDPAEIIVDKKPDLFGGREVAHILTNDKILTIDTETMESMVDDINLNRGYYRRDWTHASVSADGRFLVTNNHELEANQIELADLVNRTSKSLPLGTNFDYILGVAFNRAWENRDQFAVFGIDFIDSESRLVDASLVTYKFNGQNDPIELDKWSAQFTPYARYLDNWGPKGSIAWSGSGSHLIASFIQDPAEFKTFNVDERGKLTAEYSWTACQNTEEYNYANLPNDIWTVNGLIDDPNKTPTEGSSVPTATAKPTRTPTETSTQTATLTATSSNTPSPTGTSTETETITVTPSSTPSSTSTETSTNTPTSTPTDTSEPSFTPTSTERPTSTSTSTDTATSTDTPTSTETDIPTSTPTPTATLTETIVPTATETETETVTVTATSTSTATSTYTPIPTETNIPSSTPTSTATHTEIPTTTSTATSTIYTRRFYGYLPTLWVRVMSRFTN